MRRAAGKDTTIAVAGCVAQAEGAEIIARAPYVDLVIGPQSYHRLPELLFRSRAESRHLIETSTVSYAPSMTTLARCRERIPRAVGRMVAVAEAEASIPAVRREVENLQIGRAHV